MSQRKLPSEFIEDFNTYGPAEAEKVLKSLAYGEPSVAVRANRLKSIELVDNLETVPWLDSGAYLSERPMFAADPAWHQGLYYVQDASSMAFTAIVAELSAKYFDNKPLRYLDSCAAPGGKTIAAIEGLPAGSIVVSNEYDRQRLGALAENTAKHGYPSVVITNNDAAAFSRIGAMFDIVAVDAPCSGEGMFRKEDEAVRQWSPSLVRQCAATQRRIVDGAWAALRGGGIMIYSTCTFNPAEDEEIVRYLIDNHGAETIELVIGKHEGIAGASEGFDMHACHFFPGLVRGEGLFVAALRKPDNNEPSSTKKNKNAKTEKVPQSVADFAKNHIHNFESYIILPSGSDSFCLIPRQHADFCRQLAAELNVVRQGVPLCTVKGKDLVPSWQLAYSLAFDTSTTASIELDLASALHYLHGESLSEVPDGLPRGFVTANYKGRPMGFAKNIGRRANNLLPPAIALRLDPDKLPSPTTLIKN